MSFANIIGSASFFSKMKIGSFTTAAATGDQAVTGVGFTPRIVIFYMTVTTGGTQSFWTLGVIDSAGNQWVNMLTQSTLAAAQTVNSTACLGLHGISSAAFKSVESDGYTVTWATANAQTCHFIAFG